MDLYDVIIAPRALAQLESYIDYVQHTLLNDKAAEALFRDAMETQKQLARVAGNLKLCVNPRLRAHGYRIIRFLHHRYIMLYRVEGQCAYVDAIYHQLQDYENTFFFDQV